MSTTHPSLADRKQLKDDPHSSDNSPRSEVSDDLRISQRPFGLGWHQTLLKKPHPVVEDVERPVDSRAVTLVRLDGVLEPLSLGLNSLATGLAKLPKGQHATVEQTDGERPGDQKESCQVHSQSRGRLDLVRGSNTKHNAQYRCGSGEDHERQGDEAQHFGAEPTVPTGVARNGVGSQQKQPDVAAPQRKHHRLSNDQTFPGSPASPARQLRFDADGFEGVTPKKQRRHNYRLVPLRAVHADADSLEALYEERAGKRLAERSVPTYRWLRRDMLALAAGLAGRRISILDLFRDETLLGQVLVSDRFADGRICSKSTMAHRRTEARSLATILKPELRAALGRDPHDVIRDALRTFAERRGGGYRITGGTPRSRGGPTPSKPELQRIVAAIGQGTGWVGLRDRAIAALLAGTASRVTAMLTLDGVDCHVLPGDRVRLLLHQKNGRERHEVEVDQASATALRLYVAAYNHSMQCAGRQHRITLGAPGPIWRTEHGIRMPAKSFRDALKRACEMAGTRNYTPHAFRRAWATSASEVLPRWEGALGGGWRGTERFDASYVTPTRTAAWQKLGGLGVPALDRIAQKQAELESARAV